MLSPHFCHSIIAHMIALAVAGSVPASFGGFPHGRVVGSRMGGKSTTRAGIDATDRREPPAVAVLLHFTTNHLADAETFELLGSEGMLAVCEPS